MLAAFRRLERGELWLVGDGPLRSFVEGEAQGDPRIRVLGYADEQRLPGLYRQADILVVPSVFEAWGLVVHEGLAYGLPVITTDQVGAADDLVDSGVNGYVVPAGDHEVLAGAMRRRQSGRPRSGGRRLRATGRRSRCTGSTERRTGSCKVACSVLRTVAH